MNIPHALVIAALAALVTVLGNAAALSGSDSVATPSVSQEISAATPTVISAGDGCKALGPYFQQLAELVTSNDGLITLGTVDHDVLALTGAQATDVVTSLDDLIPRLQAITPPAAAAAYHIAYIDLIEWYRDMAATRDLLSHQRLINGDRRILPAIGRGVYLGQSICGAHVWNAAQQAAFPPHT